MQTYIALLRGINVSGRKKIRMADLVNILSGLDWKNIQTYIQSGNIVFEAEDAKESHYATIVHAKIQENYGFEVPVLVIKVETLKAIVSKSPFKNEELEKSYFTLLYSKPNLENVNKLLTYIFLNETFVLKNTCIYSYPQNGAGRAKANNNFFEKKLQVIATSRNYKTMIKLIEMSN